MPLADSASTPRRALAVPLLQLVLQPTSDERDKIDVLGSAIAQVKPPRRLTHFLRTLRFSRSRMRMAATPAEAATELQVRREPPVGIEPTTYALRVRRSGRLS